MSENDPFDPLTASLMEEAQRLLDVMPAGRPLAYLQEPAQRQRRQRRVIGVLSATTVAGLMACLGWAVWWHTEPPRQMAVRPLVVKPQVVKEPVREPEPGAHRESVQSVLIQALAELTQPVPLLMELPGTDGQTRYQAVWYVPGATSESDWDKLSPAEKGVVSQLLGPEYTQRSEDVI
ncbi:MAG: hypothetical protein JSS02_01645 [Planctomycetes bacterium]|nr:hypothetical protein [Planctomycetota bacterium]